jgi:hypothetical protein
MLQQRIARNDDENTKDPAVSWGEDAKKEAKKQRRATSDGPDGRRTGGIEC